MSYIGDMNRAGPTQGTGTRTQMRREKDVMSQRRRRGPVFRTSYPCPWALVLWGGAEQGKRPATRLAFLSRAVVENASVVGFMGYSRPRLGGAWTVSLRRFDSSDVVKFWRHQPSQAALKRAAQSLEPHWTPEPGWLCLDGFAGRSETEVQVVGVTATRYRIKAVVRTRLPGRQRWLEQGQVALVPRAAIRRVHDRYSAAERAKEVGGTP